MNAYQLFPEEGFASLRQVELASSPLGPHDVRVRVRAVSLNYRDLIIARNAKTRARPLIPASDGAGEVIAVGEKVSRVKPGDRVAANFFPAWLTGGLREEHQKNALGGTAEGMLAEEVVLPEVAWVKIPAGWSFEQGSTLPCAAVTAWHALFVASQTGPGDRVLVQGTGGVSIFALQLARAAGAQVIATSSSADKRARLEKMGAFATIDYKAEPKWGEAARAANGGQGLDLVVEVGGAGTFDQSARALRVGGTLALIGVLAGNQGPVDTGQVLHKNLRVQGIYVGSVAMFEALVRAVEVNRLSPIVDRVFAFGEARAAYEYMASGQHFGKVVIAV